MEGIFSPYVVDKRPAAVVEPQVISYAVRPMQVQSSQSSDAIQQDKKEFVNDETFLFLVELPEKQKQGKIHLGWFALSTQKKIRL